MVFFDTPCPARQLTFGPSQHFFGYYDRSPYRADLSSRDWCYPDPPDNANPPSPLAPDLLVGNGHFSLHPARPGWMLSDICPDASHTQTLFLLDLACLDRHDAYRVTHEPALGSDARCDLHPRWRPDGQAACIDALIPGQGRQMVEIDLRPILDL